MGLSSSKHNAPGPSPSSSGGAVRRSRSSGSRVLKSSCLRSHGSDNDGPQVSGCSNEENGKSVFSPTENNKSGSAQCHRTEKTEESNDVNCISSSIDLHEWGESSFTNSASREGNTSANLSSQSLNPPSRFLSRFSFYPGNLSFRLTRGNGLTSASRSYPASSASFTIPNQEVEDEDEEGECVSPSSSLGNRNERSHSRGCDFFPACFTNRPSRTRGEDCASNSSPDNRILNSGHDILSNGNNPNLFSPLNHINSERRVADREPVERNVRFSRTLSVGRLRDRVHRRTPPSDLDLCHITGRRGLSHAEVEATPVDNNISQQVSSGDVASSFPNPVYGNQNNVYENPRARETRYRDLLEHRSNFLERRRRIRSQVRALQRLGSRFENLSGHERSCILSGQHRGGHCSCRSAARDLNSNDDANARASISRIVMLAEALFEVLDEIHQQSVVLSSRPSVSSIGSVPAPNEAVDSLPLKIFSKFKRKQCDDTAAQCYICLVEYEDGDSVRILPCHHEFHRACVDKWLKEVHRVCPLCRRDICRPDSLTSAS